MATITVRALDSNGDPRHGSGLANFATDIEAVAIIITTRLKLLSSEWWEDRSTGTPLFQQLLGHPITSAGVALLLRQRILGSPYVTGIQQMQVLYGARGRTFAFFATVQTAFGPITVSNVPQA